MAKNTIWVTFILLNYLYSVSTLQCFCHKHCREGPEKNGTCTVEPGGYCFSAVEEVLDPISLQLVPERTYGCLPPGETGLLQCKGHLVPHYDPKSIGCCSDEDFCNLKLSPMYEPSNDLSEPSGTNIQIDSTTLNVLLGTLIVLLFIAVLVIILFYNYYRKKEQYQQKYVRRDPEAALRLFPGSLHELIETTSGSGSGRPRLVQQYIAKQIGFMTQIGKGSYGEVWKAKYRGTEEVAVKVFFTKDEASYYRETEIYQTVLSVSGHENILRFIAFDIKGTGISAQRLLITDYHQNGSLCDFLKINVIDERTLIKMAYSAAAGLVHLHTEINGTCVKPMIAHRDIKSRNILVKDDLSCCIADFGLAVKLDRVKSEIDPFTVESEINCGQPNPRVGTWRYMAPEVLSNKMKSENFHSYLHADVYSFSLVMWELCRRTKTGIEKEAFEDFELPYTEYLGLKKQDPKKEDMEVVIIKEDKRPTIPRRWDSTEPLGKISRLIQESWRTKPESRLSMLQIKKQLHQLKSPKIDDFTTNNHKYARISKSSSSTIPLRNNHLITS